MKKLLRNIKKINHVGADKYENCINGNQVIL